MDIDTLYVSCLKMLNDKFNIKEYSKEKFINIYNNTYKENNKNPLIPIYEINRLILVKIKNDINEEINKKDEINNNEINEKIEEENNKIDEEPRKFDIENKLKEFENIRASMNLISSSIEIKDNINEEENNIEKLSSSINSIQINNQDLSVNNKYKTFIINTNKNNFKVSINVNILQNNIYPCYLNLPFDIKYKTPYIILSINDNNDKIVNYTFIPKYNNNNIWDIWKPITDNYININLNTNNWNINLIDNLNNIIDFSNYYSNIKDVLENNSNNTFSLSIDNENNFNINNKIKIIKENGIIIDNIFIIDKNKDNNRIIIKKNNLNLSDFINSKIYNYNNQISLLFKYYSK